MHPFILPSRHAHRLILIFHEHLEAGHAGSFYKPAKTRQRFWIINGISSVKYFLSHCSICARNRAAPVCQFMADLPVCHVMACNKPFKFCGIDCFGKTIVNARLVFHLFMHSLHTCRASYESGLDNFLLAFSRFTNSRGAVDTIFYDNAFTFKAADNQLPKLLNSPQLVDSFRKTGY